MATNKHVVIDARESGTSTGRYVDKLVENLAGLRPDFKTTLLAKSHRIEALAKLAPDFEIVRCDVKEFTFAEQLALPRRIRSLKPDLVHFAMTQQPVLYRQAKVTTVHDLITARFTNPAKNPLFFKIKQLVYRSVIHSVAKQSKVIITPSEFVKKDLASFAHINPDKIRVTYEAADKISVPAEELAALKSQQFILYVGRSTPHKNLPRLIEAFEKVVVKKPGLKLVLAGKFDANYGHLQKLVAKKSLTSQVIFPGFIEEGQLRWLYEHALAYVLPSLSEGFGLPGLEAMAHGLPVASSNAACLPEVYKDGAVYFDPTDTSDMADKVLGLISEADVRAAMTKRGRAVADSYSWQKMAKETLDIYSQILG